jgi:glucose/arabinose dehydrogenase
MSLSLAQSLPPSVCNTQSNDATPRIELEPVASGLTAPVLLTHAGDGSGRLFVVEKQGRIRVIRGDEVLDEPFLDISNLIVTEGEQGLLGLAFHPRYAENSRFFVYYSAQGRPRSVIAEYRVSEDEPNRAAPEGEVVLEVFQPPTPYHKAGQLKFGPDGYLYIAFGDGGAALQSQSRRDLLGTIARIDVDQGKPYTIPNDNPFVKAAMRELAVANEAGHPAPHASYARGSIWAYGLRNPWRFSFDPCTGRLFAGDVGEASYEEINLIEPGKNYGWPYMEGPDCHPDHVTLCVLGRSLGWLAEPVHSYPNFRLDPEGGGGRAVVGGYVYRGQAFPELLGRYFFADVASGRIWALSEDPKWRVDEVFQRDGRTFVSFGEDEDGEIYLVSINSATIERIVVPRSP